MVNFLEYGKKMIIIKNQNQKKRKYFIQFLLQ